MKDRRCTVVLLTFNSADIIRETARQALKVDGHVYAVDSNSSDGTVAILEELGCTVVQRKFSNYSDQRNWAIEQIAALSEWQLHLDADEVLDETAVAEVRAIVANPQSQGVYLLRRRDYFMGKMLRFSGVNPWHLRLFRAGEGRCESRMYDQHFVSDIPAHRLKGFMHDKNALSLTEWVARHNRWSDLEAREADEDDGAQVGVLKADAFGDPRERTRFLKRLYYRLPGGLRASSYFIYRYIFRLGFLDGMTGFYFAFFQGFWFRMLVDAKIYERRASREKGDNA